VSAKSKSKKEEPQKKKVDEHKYENYFDFTIPTKYLKAHQILALNRGENHKILSIKLTFKDNVRRDLHNFLVKQYLSAGKRYESRLKMFDNAFDEAYTKKCKLVVK
jgi:transcriptional accessory protein Tex/SPT6